MRLSRRIVGASLLLAAAGVAVMAWRQGRRPQPPMPADFQPVPRKAHSLLLITVDTTRADHLQPYGAKDVATPALQRLAEQGVVFENAYSVAPITLVAHTSILTGRYPPEHGVRNNGLHYVPPDVLTVAERLRSERYRTAAFVSAAVLEKRYGLDQGFERYDDDLSTGRERHPRMVPDRPGEATVAAARAWLDDVGDRDRFFLWVHFYDPHAAYSPPPPYRDRYRGRLYDGEIAYMDAQIERLLSHPRLDRDRTVVAVMGDHGESLGEHGEDTHALLAYDATLRIPWIMRVPGARPGRRVFATVGQVDFLPTVLDLLGVSWDGKLSGRSVAGLVEGRPEESPPPLYAETYLPYYTYGWAKLRSLRQGRWKYVDAPRPELYDLARDPRELSNLIEEAPGRAHDIRRDLEGVLQGFGDAEREMALALDSESAEKLRSLGYLAVGSPRPRAGSRPDPKDVIDLHVGLETARQLMRDRLYREAVRRLRAVLDRDPDNLAALMDLAQALEADGHLDEAVRAAERALVLDARYPRAYVVMAHLENRRRNGAQALKLLDRALELDPRFIEAHAQKTLMLLNGGRQPEAETAVRRALQLHPEHPRLEALHAQAVEMRAGRWPEAEGRLRAALRRDPFLVLGWRLLGEVLEQSGRGVEAAEAYRDGLKRQPDDADLHGRVGLLLAKRGGDPRAEAHLREAIRLSDHLRSELHVALGAYLAEAGRMAEALPQYELVLSAEPRNAAARNNRAIGYYRSGRLDEALTEWKALAVAFPRYADVHNNLAAAALDRKQWTAAERHARRALAGAPTAEAWSNLGVALDEQGRAEQAKECFRKALALDPQYWIARNNLATTLRKQERWAEAALGFEEVLQQVPTQPDVHLELGDLYAGPLADLERARQHYNAFLRGAPRHARAQDVRRRLSGLRP